MKSYREGAVANVVVYDFWRDGYQDLYLNGVEEASSRLWHVQLFKLLGILPPLVHPHPGDTLMIAFGAGISAGAAESAVERLSVVELNPDVEAVAAAFRTENRDVLRSPRFELIVNDGRNHLWMAPRRYSVVISDATHPMSFDSWTLYSREFYALVKSRLEPGGVFAQWIPMPLAGDATRVILKTFKSVFPHTSLWMIHGSSQCMLLGTPERLSLDYPTLRDRLTPLLDSAGLREYGIGDLTKLLGFFALGEERIERYLGDFSRVSTDDLPYPQFYGGLDQAGVQTSLELVSYLETAEGYLTRTGSEAARLHQDLGRYLRIARALDRGFLKSGALEYEKARLLAEGTRWQDDENIKSALFYDRKYEEYFTRRVARYPRDHYAHHSLGMVWLQAQKYARASEEFGRALELAPDFARAALGLARSHTEAGQYDLATRDWLRLRRMNPTPGYLGEATEQLGVIRVLRKLRFRPHDAALYRELAELHARQGRPVQAIRALRQGLGQTDFDPELLTGLADLCHTLDLPEVALTAYAGALGVRPDDPQLAGQMSSIREQAERPMAPATSETPPPGSASEGRLRQVLQQWNEQPYDGKVARSTLEKTAELLLAVIREDDRQMQAYAELSTVYEHLGRYRDAAGILAKGLGITPGFEAAERQKERLELLDRLESGLGSGEDRGGVYRRVSELYFELGEFELSIDYLLQALGLNPRDPRGWSNLGFLYLSTGELERALDALRRALSLDPSSDELRRRAAEVESLIGDRSAPSAGH